MPTFLTSGEHLPYARLLDWDTGVERPLAALPGVFFNSTIIRDGWIALGYNGGDVVLGTCPEVGTGMRLPGGHAAAHEDPLLVWTTDKAGFARPYDGAGRAGGPAVAVPGGWLTAAYGGAWLQWNHHTGATTYWSAAGRPRDVSGWYPTTSAGPLAIALSRNGKDIAVINLRDGSLRVVAPPAIHRWCNLVSLSPDGCHLALSAVLHEETPAPADVPIGEAGRWRYQHYDELAPDRANVMVVVDLQAGTCRVAEGTFDNFASAAAWTADSSSLVFGVPFEPDTTIGRLSLDTMQVELRRFPAGIGTPRVDVTGLLEV